MDLQQALEKYGSCVPEQRAAVQRLLLPLYRKKIETLEEMRRLYLEEPETLQAVRNIGPKSMEMIGEILQFYERCGPSSPEMGNGGEQPEEEAAGRTAAQESEKMKEVSV